MRNSGVYNRSVYLLLGKSGAFKQINESNNNKKYGLAVIYGIQLFIEKEYLAFFVLRVLLFLIIKHYELKKKISHVFPLY